MTWLLAHRPIDGVDVTIVERDDASSADAVAAVQESLPEGHKLLSVRRK